MEQLSCWFYLPVYLKVRGSPTRLCGSKEHLHTVLFSNSLVLHAICDRSAFVNLSGLLIRHSFLKISSFYGLLSGISRQTAGGDVSKEF